MSFYRVLAKQAVSKRSFYHSARCLENAKIYEFSDICKIIESKPKNKVLIDVREPEEVKNSGKIPTAINVPIKSAPGALNLPEDEFEDMFQVSKPKKEDEVIFYCQAGVRSSLAEELAQSFGYEKRGNYLGSFNDWLEKNGKIDK